MRHLPAVDGLRAIAVLAVVAYHAGLPVPGGFVGVDVFFVISGYLITRLLHDEIRATGRVDFMAFYARRARRILPALVVVMLATLAASSVMLSPADHDQALGSATAALLFTANLFFQAAPNGYFDPGVETMPLLHLWSIGVEEQFYLIWPAVLILARRNLVLAMTTIAVGSLMLAEWWLWLDPQAAFYQMPARAWELALGGLVAIRPFRLPRHAAWTGLAVVLAACFLPLGHFPGVGALPAVAGTALLIAGIHRGDRLAVLESRPMVSIGLISYSLYLWHWPVLLLGKPLMQEMGSGQATASLVGLSFVLAVITYRMIESPIRRSRPSIARPAATVLAALAVMAGGAWVAVWSTPAVAPAPARTQGPSIYAMGCDDWYSSAVVNPCVFGPHDALQTAVVIGDSIGLQWFPALTKVFDRPGWRLIVLTKSSCPMAEVPFYYPRLRREYTECGQWRAEALLHIAGLKADKVIIGSTYSYGFSQAEWTEGTADVLQAVTASAGHVHILRSTPIPASNERGTASNPQSEDVHRWIGDAAARFDNVSQVDMNDLVCPNGRCRPLVGGVPVFRDTQHLNAPFAATMSSQLAARLGMPPVIVSLDR